MKPLNPADLPSLRARLAVDRPLHWGLARAMLTALEAAWRELGRLPEGQLAEVAAQPQHILDQPPVQTLEVTEKSLPDASRIGALQSYLVTRVCKEST